MAEAKFLADELESVSEIGERHLLQAILRAALQDWFSFGCNKIKNKKFRNAQQSRLYHYFFEFCEEEDYGSFHFITDYISNDPKALRKKIRDFLRDESSKMALVAGNKNGNPLRNPIRFSKYKND